MEVVKKNIFSELVRKFNRIQAIYDSEFVKKTDYVTKIRVIENKIPNCSKYITNSDYVEFTSDIIQE